MGDPRLYTESTLVSDDEFDSLLPQLLEDMLDTMRHHNGAGIAAPQIGVFKRVVIFGIDKNPRYPDVRPVPLTILVNPELDATGIERAEAWEGCLSVPGMRGKVSRFQQIIYRGLSPERKNIEILADGFHARVVQHEVDHLDGILYPARIKDLKDFGFIKALEASGRIPRIEVPES